MSSRKSRGDGASSSKRKATTPSSSSSSLHTDDDSLSSKSNNSSSDEEKHGIDLMAERIYCSCQLCKEVVVQTQRKSIQHCDRHSLYTPPQPAAPTCHPPIIDKSELEALFRNVSAKVAADALQDLDRILGLSPLPAVDNIQTSSAKRVPRTRLQTSGREIKDISLDDTIVISGRHGPTSLTGLAAKRFIEYDSTVQEVPRIIPTHTPVEIWSRRWIVKESTLPDIGLGVFAMDKIEVAPNCIPDNLPQLFPYAGAVYKYAAYRLLKKHIPYFRDYILACGALQRCPPHKRRYIDGDPVRCGNIAGYIQSTAVPSKIIQRKTNAEWHFVEGGHEFFSPNWNKGFHIMTVATKTIEAGEEYLFLMVLRGIKNRK
ncbi:hypothetical protein R1sor_014998 [Riccia sorocarpa]|uniref:Uncharacterized protein n=1 Tax=Riccia sorocarpa TaxID=122646 RepID=A0ABD3HEV8_9MARC